MPLLEKTGHMPSTKYAHGPEILEHCQRIGTYFGLYDNALFRAEVEDLLDVVGETEADRLAMVRRLNTVAVDPSTGRAAIASRTGGVVQLFDPAIGS